MRRVTIRFTQPKTSTTPVHMDFQVLTFTSPYNLINYKGLSRQTKQIGH